MMRSPFHVIENFVSPLRCEEIVERLGLKRPSYDENGQPLKYECHLPMDIEGPLLSEFDAQAPMIEDRYGSFMRGDPTLLFQQYWENLKRPAEFHNAEGWEFKRKKWSKTKDVDLVGILWLKDYQGSVPYDPRMEVYGGKLEFPSYNFSLVPARGTLVIFPATPHFVSATSHILLGSLEQVKFNVRLKDWKYDPSEYPGTYTEWFLGEP